MLTDWGSNIPQNHLSTNFILWFQELQLVILGCTSFTSIHHPFQWICEFPVGRYLLVNLWESQLLSGETATLPDSWLAGCRLQIYRRAFYVNGEESQGIFVEGSNASLDPSATAPRISMDFWLLGDGWCCFVFLGFLKGFFGFWKPLAMSRNSNYIWDWHGLTEVCCSPSMQRWWCRFDGEVPLKPHSAFTSQRRGDDVWPKFWIFLWCDKALPTNKESNAVQRPFLQQHESGWPNFPIVERKIIFQTNHHDIQPKSSMQLGSFMLTPQKTSSTWQTANAQVSPTQWWGTASVIHRWNPLATFCEKRCLTTND